MKTHAFNANGLHILFAFTDDAPVKLLNFSFAKSATIDLSGNLAKWSRLIEVQACGQDWDDHHGNKYTGTNPAGLLRYKSHYETRTMLGKRLEIVQEGGGLKITSYIQVIGKLSAIRTWTEVVSTSQEPSGLRPLPSLFHRLLAQSRFYFQSRIMVHTRPPAFGSPGEHGDWRSSLLADRA